MFPVIALVGRPNVGKSTLFNRLTKTRDALVASIPGLTRDRQYGRGVLGEFDYVVVDTGGLSGEDDGIDGPMAAQSKQAIEEADLILFLVDAKSGRMPGDHDIAALLRGEDKPVVLVANKVDGQNPDYITGEFAELGFGVSARILHRGRRLLADVDAELSEHRDGFRAHAGGYATGTRDLHASWREMPGQALSHLTPRRIGDAQKEDVHVVPSQSFRRG